MSEDTKAAEAAAAKAAAEANLTPEEKAKREAKKKAKEEAKAAKLEKLRLKKEKQAAMQANSKAAKKGDDKKKKELRLRREFINTTPKGEKKDLSEPMAAAYDPPAVEAAWYEWWEEQGFFKPNKPENKDKFVIVIPPPNVTGALHLGHALTSSVQDALTRWHRMQGKDVVWVPGTDHAGIATQRVVEAALARDEQLTRHDLGREKFVERVWQWKEKFGGKITSQERRIGVSVDWTREVFTMDEKLSVAVGEAFVRFFDKGLIYRADRLVNYCCQLETAISDVEVDHIEVPTPMKMKVPGHGDKMYEFGKLWLFAYKLVAGAETGKDGETRDEIVVATTRPETMLGDVAVAVHPEDERYNHLIGKKLKHPFCEQEVTIVGDSTLVKMEFGTGAVKVTPAHDPNDYECGQRHKLPLITVFTNDGRIAECGGEFKGMMRFDARVAVLKRLEELGLGRGEEPSAMTLPICSRSKDVIEPMLCPQWYMNCNEMAKRAADAVRSKELEIVPSFHEQTWFYYLDNIRDWCISRQLWWGHRVPVYRVFIDGKAAKANEEDMQGWVAARSEAEALAKAAKQHNVPASSVRIEQDEDVLDTWFSSGLFPFSVFGWPEQTADLARFFPTSVLETGHDILFFWVARMVMMSLELTDKLPFKRVLLHAMVRDAHGGKMSKSKGNVIDPVQVIEGIALEDLHETLRRGNLPAHEVKKAIAGQKKDFPSGIPECGTDALRFGLCAYTMQGRDINLDVNRVAAYRNFCNKLWNVIKFALSNLPDGFVPSSAQLCPALSKDATLEERWIMSRLSHTIVDVDEGLRDFQLGASAQSLYAFWLNDFCDVFLESTKPYLRDSSDASVATKSSIHNTLYTCIDVGLRLLHPFMPFVTEELWQRMARRPGDGTESICIAAWPSAEQARANWHNDDAEAAMREAQELIASLRSLRGRFGLTKKDRPRLAVQVDAAAREAHLRPLLTLVQELAQVDAPIELSVNAKVGDANAAEEVPSGAVAVKVNAGCSAFMFVLSLIDVEALRAQLVKRKAKAEQHVESQQKKMSIEGYEEKVPADVREKNAESLASLQNELLLLESTLSALK